MSEIVRRSGDTTWKLAFSLGLRSKSGRPSSIFDKHLKDGYPAPTLKLMSEGKSVLMELERKYPGSLRRLIHPAFPLLSGPSQVADIFQLLRSCDRRVQAIFHVDGMQDAALLASLFSIDPEFGSFSPTNMQLLHDCTDVGGLEGLAGIAAWIVLWKQQEALGLADTEDAGLLRTIESELFLCLSHNVPHKLERIFFDAARKLWLEFQPTQVSENVPSRVSERFCQLMKLPDDSLEATTAICELIFGSDSKSKVAPKVDARWAALQQNYD